LAYAEGRTLLLKHSPLAIRGFAEFSESKEWVATSKDSEANNDVFASDHLEEVEECTL